MCLFFFECPKSPHRIKVLSYQGHYLMAIHAELVCMHKYAHRAAVYDLWLKASREGWVCVCVCAHIFSLRMSYDQAARQMEVWLPDHNSHSSTERYEHVSTKTRTTVRCYIKRIHRAHAGMRAYACVHTCWWAGLPVINCGTLSVMSMTDECSKVSHGKNKI